MNGISVVNPVGWAIERTKHVLFGPFDVGMWFVLGFCCFLAHLTQNAQGGCQAPPGNWGTPAPGGGGGPGQGQIQNILPTIIAIAAIVLLVIVAFVILVTWIDSRGKFMFLDGVVHKRGAVIEPWKSFKAHGNSLFKFRVVFGFLVFGVMLAIVSVAVAIAWPDIQAGEFRAGALTAVIGGSLLLLLVGLVHGIVALFLTDFVVPVMYARNQYCMPAWSIFRHELLAGRGWTFVLYVLMKIVLGLGMGMIIMMGTCITCCIAGLPYLSSVVFLPLWVFDRCYPLAFLEQFGPEWAIMARPGGHYCRWCGYDLRYSDRSGRCPQCGRTQDAAGEFMPQAPPTMQPDQHDEPPGE